jgi:hypothetical protein
MVRSGGLYWRDEHHHAKILLTGIQQSTIKDCKDLTLAKCLKLMLSEYIKRKVKKMSPLNGRKCIKAVPSPLSHHPLLSIYVQMFNDDVYATLLFGYLFPSSDV